ncbi:MAG: MYG1 family protein, partial [Simkaniaceae bacterium]|nr:MYG1 family protein [Simkaniaceae bacterium]
HDGTFHADEVVACALLILFDLVDEGGVIRSRSEEKWYGCDFVCDVGGVYDPKKHRFDHHQPEYSGSLSSAGMVLLHLKEEGVIAPGLVDYLNRSLVIGVDAIDTGKLTLPIGYCTFSEVVANFMPADYGAPKEEVERAFYRALDFALDHLRRLVKKFAYIERCRETIKREMDKGRKVLRFERAMPWMESFFDLGGRTHPALFLLMPSGIHWKLRGIPPSYEERMGVRVPLPERWAGLGEEKLREVSGIEGAIFCHKGRFISIWKTEGDALRALDVVWKECVERDE